MNYSSYQVPISVKGIVIENGKVWLRKNERGEWELPGGKLEKGEQPQETVTRELKEELGMEVKVRNLVEVYLFRVESVDQIEGSGVLVISYLCDIERKIGDFEWTGEGGKAEFQSFTKDQIENLNIPLFYKEAINKVY